MVKTSRPARPILSPAPPFVKSAPRLARRARKVETHERTNMQSNARFNPMASTDEGGLVRAVELGDARRVAALLASGVHADARGDDGATPLMRASAKGFADIARLLLDAGADARARRDDGFTPLLFAVFGGHTTVARMLLENGADATARTRLGTSAVSFAAARGFAEIDGLLRESLSRVREERATEETTETLARASRTTKTVETPDGAELIQSIGRAEISSIGRAEPSSSADDDVRAGETGREAARRKRLFFSWRAAAGLVLVALAFGVGVFTFWRSARMQRPVQIVAPSAQTLPAPNAASQPAGATGTPSAVAPVAPVEGQGEAVQGVGVFPQTSGQSLVAPDVPPVVAPGSQQGGAPSSPARVAEDGETLKSGAPVARREGEGATGEGDGSRVDDGARVRAPLRVEPVPATEFQPDPAPSPVPTQTPARRKVIQWPPS